MWKEYEILGSVDEIIDLFIFFTENITYAGDVRQRHCLINKQLESMCSGMDFITRTYS